MQTTTPWTLTVPLNDELGWEETKCIVCQVTNPSIIIKFDKSRIKQFPNPIMSNCGYKKVRHVPAGSPTSHPAVDHLDGTAVYSDATDDSFAWSIEF